MKENIINPTTGIYPATADYVHALELSEIERFLFVSGTMGLDQNSNAPDNLEDQLSLIWLNIRQILRAANMTTDNIIRVTSYLRDVQFAEANQSARLTALGNRRVPTTAIIVDTLKSDWFVEIEIMAAQ